eukprot:g197.t1
MYKEVDTTEVEQKTRDLPQQRTSETENPLVATKDEDAAKETDKGAGEESASGRAEISAFPSPRKSFFGRLSPTRRSPPEFPPQDRFRRRSSAVFRAAAERVKATGGFAKRVSRGLGSVVSVLASGGVKQRKLSKSEQSQEKQAYIHARERVEVLKAMIEHADIEEDTVGTPRQRKMLSTLESPRMEIFMMVLTFYALFGADFNTYFGSSSFDIGITVLSGSTMLIFLLEWALLSKVKPKYFGGAFFWLDLFAAISLLGDIPYIRDELLPSGAAAARAGRASRAGTRAGRLVRLVRLTRLVRMFRLECWKKRRKESALAKGSGRNKLGQKHFVAGDLSEKISKLTTAKVIVGLLALLLTLPFLDSSSIDKSNENGLAVLRAHIDALSVGTAQCTFPGNVASGQSACLDESLLRKTIHDFGKMYTNAVELHLHLPAGTEITTDFSDSTGTGTTVTVLSSGIVDVVHLYRARVDVEHLREHSEIEWLYLAKNMDGSHPSRYEDADSSCRFDVEEAADYEAKMALYTTTFVVVLIVVAMIAFSWDAKRFAKRVTDPIEVLCQEMSEVARLEFDDTKLKPSKVYEIRKMQNSFIKMKSGLRGFVKYAPQDVVRHMLSQGEDAKLEVAPKRVSIMFSHIHDFDALCDSLQPNALLEILAKYFDSVTKCIHESDGTLLDFIGDMVLAVWNAPSDVENHASVCIEGMLSIFDYLREMKRTASSLELFDKNSIPVIEVEDEKDGLENRQGEGGGGGSSTVGKMKSSIEMVQTSASSERRSSLHRKMKQTTIQMTVGINTAKVFVGNIGADARMKYSVLGDGVNLASRVQGLNNMYNTKLLIAHPTFMEPLVQKNYIIRPIDCVAVKGKDIGVKIYEIMGRRKQNGKGQKHLCALQQLHTKAMSLYFTQKFHKAAKLFKEVTDMQPGDKPATVLAARCLELAENPPGNSWDGCRVLKSKHF